MKFDSRLHIESDTNRAERKPLSATEMCTRCKVAEADKDFILCADCLADFIERREEER